MYPPKHYLVAKSGTKLDPVDLSSGVPLHTHKGSCEKYACDTMLINLLVQFTIYPIHLIIYIVNLFTVNLLM